MRNHFPMFNEPLQITVHEAMRASYEALQIEDDCHPFWIVSTVRRGNVVTTTRGQEFTACAGTAMVHPPRVPFSETAAGPGVHDVLFFDATVEAGLALFQFCLVTPTVALADYADWSEIFERLLIVRRRSPTPFDLTAFGLTAQLLGLVIAGWQAAGSTPRPASLATPEDKWTRLVRYMSRHLGEKLGRDELAALVHLHPVSFSRAFREAVGQPPMRLLRELRLSAARQMLETTDDTLETIAERSGFEEAAYFSRVFHERFGLPPGRYRSLHRESAGQIQESVKSAISSYSGSWPPAL